MPRRAPRGSLQVVALVLKSFVKLLAALPAAFGEFLVEVVTELAEHLRTRRAAAAARKRQRAREAEGRSHDERLRIKKAAAEAESGAAPPLGARRGSAPVRRPLRPVPGTPCCKRPRRGPCSSPRSC